MRIARVTALVAALVLSGCGGPGDDDVESQLREQRSAARSAVGDVVGAVGDGSGAITFAGRPTMCGGEPSPKIQFSAQGTWTDGPDSQASRIQTLAAGLREAGWTVTSSGRSADGAPNVRLSRGPMRLMIDPSPRRGSEDVVVQITGQCIDAPSQYVNDQVSRTDEPLDPS